MDLNEDEKRNDQHSTTASGPATSANQDSPSSDSSDSPPPLPPGEDSPLPPIPPPSPTPSVHSFYTPANSPFLDNSADRYAPISPTPSPFLSEEEYLECLLNWRLKHLEIVQQREDELEQMKDVLESDKVSEISSDEKETDFVVKRRPTTDEDRMSLSSLSSNPEMIEEVSVPLNPYGSYTFGQNSIMQHTLPPSDPREPPDRQFNSFIPPPGHPPPAFPWGNYPPPRYPVHPGGPHMPYRMFPPMGQAPVMPNAINLKPELPELTNDHAALDPVETIVEAALESVTELLRSTLEKDLIKRMTEALAFHELELWWAAEEKKYKSQFAVEDVKDAKEEKIEEKKTTTESLLNAIIDSNYDGGFMTSGLGLGFRAALPKMPSFRRKIKAPSPTQDGNDSAQKVKMNESDEEEMVQQSDSDNDTNEPEPTMTKKRQSRRSESSDSPVESSSESDSSEYESAAESEHTDSETESAHSLAEETARDRDNFLDSVDLDLVERMREKTPEGRVTPLPVDSFSDDGSEDYSKPPKTPDIHLSDQEDLPRTPSPNGPRSSALEALSALGLDEFVCDIKFRDDFGRKSSKSRIRTPSPTIPTSSDRHKSHSRRKEKKRPSKETKVQPAEKEPPKLVTSIPTTSEKENLSEDSNSVPYIAIEHSYSRPKDQSKDVPVPSWTLDHDYSTSEVDKKSAEKKKKSRDGVKSTNKERKKTSEKLVSHLLDAYLKKPPRVPIVYPAREPLQEMMICYEFLTKGVDQEDIGYLRQMYEHLLADESQSYWMNDMHWVPHSVTDSPDPSSKRHRLHSTGCARTEGYYKLDPHEKQRHRHHYNKNKAGPGTIRGIQAIVEPKANVAASREARSNQRRLLTAFGTDNDSDLLKFNQLKFRKKQLKFSKSEIHDWGLFAMEAIAADEMVIEYVGQMVRPFLADFREKGYEKRGIGSSYLFRIDAETIIDATHCGNLSRFINHSCNPNCYAKIITIEGEKKIVIYSKKDIQVDEEITYDYKFPFEEEKIKCLCGAPHCKGFLN